MRISVFGCGYVGVVVGVGFAESGNDVVCYDTDEDRVKKLASGKAPFYEPQLEELLQRNLCEKRLRFTTDKKEAIHHGYVIFVAVGTPSLPDGACDLSAIYEVAETIAEYANSPKILVIKSTVPVGTARRLTELLRSKTDQKITVVSNPEFMKEGAAVADFMKPSRIVVGTDEPEAQETMRRLYEPFMRTRPRIIFMSNESAEMTKLSANAFLAMKISFINEIANICEKVGADINQVRLGISTDPRIGPLFLFPGVGYGGSCLPKDVANLLHIAREAGYEPLLIGAANEVNRRQRQILLRKMDSYFGGNVRDLTACVWGLAFKPQTDDVRESPAIDLIKGLLARGVKVRAFDPAATKNAEKLLPNSVSFCETMYEAAEKADMLFVVTEWQEFRGADFQRLLSIMHQPVIFDGRNIYDGTYLRRMGFSYFGIGLGEQKDETSRKTYAT